MDWDGAADVNDEWIEVFNGSGQTVDLGGFVLDDEPDSAATLQSSTPYVIPVATIIEPGGFLVFYRRDTFLLNKAPAPARRLNREPLARSLMPGGQVWDESLKV